MNKPVEYKLTNFGATETINEMDILNAAGFGTTGMRCDKIQLIKWFRALSNQGLKESKDIIEAALASPTPKHAILNAFCEVAVKNGQYVPIKVDAAMVAGLVTEALDHYGAMQYTSYEQFLKDYVRNVEARGGFEAIARERWMMEHNL